jgi:polysaccharide export outer membrane protein
MHKKLLYIVLAFFGCSAAAVSQESLLIGPGDQLHVQVFDTPEMDQHPRVTDAGTVPLLFVGNVQVGGLTPGDAAKAIESILVQKQYMLHPHVQITIDEYANEEISVMGQVKDAGVYEITTPTPILSVLSMAGGLTDTADRHITIERHGDANQRISYFFSNGAERAMDQTIVVNPGDTVLVSKAPIVYILGDVARPGGYPIATNDGKLSILQAVTMAGAANHTAILSKARLIRRTPSGTQDMQIDLASIEKGKQADIDMHEDDILFLPFSWMKNAVLASSSIATSAGSALIYASHP